MADTSPGHLLSASFTRVKDRVSSLNKQQQLTAAVCAATGGVAVVGVAIIVVVRALRRPSDDLSQTKSKQLAHATSKLGKGKKNGAASLGGGQAGPLAKLKPTVDCVPLADGSACVVRRKIDADNSCLFNAVGYVMHKSKTRAPYLRQSVAREVSSDPQTFNNVFLGMANPMYCDWILNPMNWGGGIELSILSKHYNREIAAWNIESRKCHVFGEDSGYRKQAMVIYNGVHYDALAVSNGPRADPVQDITEFNPRTKRGKMILAAAQTLVDLNHRSSHFVSPQKATVQRLKCQDCGVVLGGQQEVTAHAVATGHINFEQV